jgi:pimeloyl-ACP methyl ester carboxylesterase
MDAPAEAHPPLGRTADCSRQLEAAVRFICERQGVPRVSMVAHSWGTIVAGEMAGRCPELVDRLVFFGPIARRTPLGALQHLPGWRLISLKDQWDRFVAEVPKDAKPVLSRRHFEDWGERYLDSDRASRDHAPAAVKVPSGAFQDIYDAWAGELAYEPGRVRAPVAIVRGEWDGMCPDADARWLFDAFSNSPDRRDIKIGRATHLMHLEENRFALYRETECFLNGGDSAGDLTRLA